MGNIVRDKSGEKNNTASMYSPKALGLINSRKIGSASSDSKAKGLIILNRNS